MFSILSSLLQGAELHGTTLNVWIKMSITKLSTNGFRNGLSMEYFGLPGVEC